MAFSREAFTGAKATRHKIARLLNGADDEISLVRSTAEGFDIVGHGLTWREGDEVIYGAGDHPAARAIWAILARRHGVRPIRLELLPAGAWQQWDRQRLARTGGVLEQYKHPCLISDPAFRETMNVEEEMASV